MRRFCDAGMTLLLRIALNVVSLLINIGLVYFGVRLLLIFRGGKMEKSWFYIAAGAFCLALGSLIFSAYYILGLPTLVHPLGGLASVVGGIFILAGLWKEFKSWSGTM
jgi:hypothetical protein